MRYILQSSILKWDRVLNICNYGVYQRNTSSWREKKWSSKAAQSSVLASVKKRVAARLHHHKMIRGGGAQRIGCNQLHDAGSHQHAEHVNSHPSTHQVTTILRVRPSLGEEIHQQKCLVVLPDAQSVEIKNVRNDAESFVYG